MEKNKYFVDTSALFKRYIVEDGTEWMDKLLERAGSFIISNLSIVECVSNLKRLVDIDKKIESDTFQMALENLFMDMENGVLEVEPATSKMMMLAVDYINGRYITPIDAVQLAVLNTLKEKHGKLIFVCADKKLLRLATRYGFEAMSPY